jgi:hypothetical protein
MLVNMLDTFLLKVFISTKVTNFTHCSPRSYGVLNLGG